MEFLENYNLVELHLLKMSSPASWRISSQIVTVCTYCSSVQTLQGPSTCPTQTSGFAGKQVPCLQTTCALRMPSCLSGLIGTLF